MTVIKNLDSLSEKKRFSLLLDLKKISGVYQKCSNEQKVRLFEASDSLLTQLSTMGYPRIISESLLMFGDEFYWKEHLQGAGDAVLGEVFGK